MSFNVDERGYYGNFGGAFIPEMLYPNVEELRSRYLDIIAEPSFQEEFRALLKDYVGRPTPLFKAERLSAKYNTNIYLKREDLCHTGAHKINNTIGQILVAKRLGKSKIVAETGAGQHGVATATVCALMGMECIVYTNEAMRHWINHPVDTHYIIGSVVGPHPYPDMVARFQAVISEEIRFQLQEKEGRDYPDYVIACVGGGSNAAGAFYHFLDEPRTALIAAEAAGLGVNSGHSAATTFLGKPGVLHGSKSLSMQTEDGQVIEPYSISAGLDYPGIGPMHAHLFESGRATFYGVTDEEALVAAVECSQLEGIIPALETAHALAVFERLQAKPNEIVVVNVSGRGDKDLATYQNRLKLND